MTPWFYEIIYSKSFEGMQGPASKCSFQTLNVISSDRRRALSFLLYFATEPAFFWCSKESLVQNQSCHKTVCEFFIYFGRAGLEKCEIVVSTFQQSLKLHPLAASL